MVKKTALIVGATSSVAEAVSERLVEEGYALILVGRDAEKLSKLAGVFSNDCLATMHADFTHPAAVNDVIETIEADYASLDLIFIAHGFLCDQLAVESDVELALQSFETNLFGALRFIIPLANLLERNGKGKLAVITSVAGDRGRPRNYNYGAAKGALSIYLQGLRSRLYGTGVEIYTFKLGPVDTPMTVNHEKNFSFSTPEKVADIMNTALKGRRYEVYVPGWWRVVLMAVRVMPESLFQRLKFLSGR